MIFSDVVSKLYLISNLRKDVREGGMARNLAFQEELLKRNAQVYSFSSMNFFYRIWSFVKILFLLLFVRKSTFVILQNTFITYLFPLPLFRYYFLVEFITRILKYSLKRNIIYFEINDLIYEQSKDLKLNVNPNCSIYQDFIFTISGMKFIFASNKMREYIINKYNIEYKNTQVILNGAPELLNADKIKSEAIKTKSGIKFVYVGTLNRGRQIEELINIFDNSKHELYLMGSDGEWINVSNKKNVFYIGSFDEYQALKKTSQFDMGVIPYDNTAFYYNLCYPTKNSFYLSSGLPILSTPLEETQNVFKLLHEEIAVFAEIKNWKSIIENLDKSQITLLQENVKKIKNKIYWSHILSELKLDILY